MNRYWQLCISLLLQTIPLIADRLAENLIVDVNFERPIAVTSRAFLSITVDPATLLNNIDVFTVNVKRSTNMARGLIPAYIRFGGPRSNSHDLERTYSDTDNTFFVISWTYAHRWANDAGLHVISCISPDSIENESGMRLGNSTGDIEQLLIYSHRTGYNISWQLGYECQTRCNLSGRDLGRRVANFREMLKTFPRYSNSLITGPDVVAYKTAQQRKYLRDYFDSAGAALSAITWHPDFGATTVNNDSIALRYDDMAADKDELYKVVDRATREKPLWIAESRSEEGKHQYLGALVWTRRLGDAAKLGIQVVMRQMFDFSKTTPDYWVSLLHKTLVGREVLEVNVQSDNGSHVHLYCQCTRPSALYDKGAVTIFGVNFTPRDVIANLRGLGRKTLHKYILSPDSQAGENEIFSEKVLLNDKQLELVDGRTLPDLNPEIVTDRDDIELRLSSGGIGFWVIPDAKVNACVYSEEETATFAAAERLLKRHENAIRRVDQEDEQKKEEEKGVRQLDTEHRKILTRHERRNQKNLGKEPAEDQQTSQLLAKLKRILRKRLRRKQKNDPLYLQKSSVNTSVEERGNSFEEAKNLDGKNFEKMKEADDKVENSYNILETMRRYKRTSMGKARVEAEHPKLEMSNVDNTMALLSKIEALLQSHDKNIASNNIRDITKNDGELVVEANSRLKKELNKLEDDYAKSTPDITEIEKYSGVFYNLLKHGERIKKDKDNHISARENSTNEKRSRRDLNETLTDPKNHIQRKLSTSHNLKNKVNDKAKSRNDDKMPLKSKLGHLNNDRSNRRGSHRRDLFKILLKDDSFSQHSTQKYRRTNRDIDRRLMGSLRMDNIFKKHSRIDNARDYVNERKTKLRNDLRRDVVPSPFNSKIESDENDFYGFPRRDPDDGFPEGDVFLTTGSSEELSGRDYDYVEDDEEDTNGKNARQEQKSTFDRAEDTAWTEQDGDHRDYVPSEFFENVKLPNTKIEKNATDYGDLHEAEFLPGEAQGDKEADNNNETIVTDVARRRHQVSNTKRDTRAYESIVLHADRFINPHDRRAKRDDRERLPMILAEEMIKESEDDASDYHYRVIRASDSSKELRDDQRDGRTIVDSNADTGRARKSATDFARSDAQNPTTEEEYERIMAGEILPSASVTETDVDRNESEVTTEIVIAESRGSNLKPRDVKQIDVLSASPTSDTETNDATKRYRDGDGSIAEGLLIDSSSGPSANDIQQVTERTLFRAQSPDTPAELEKTTYDSDRADTEIIPLNNDSREALVVPAQKATLSFYEKDKTLKKKKEIEQELIGAITENWTNAEQRHDANREVDWKPNDSHGGTTEKIAEGRTMAETVLSKRATNDSSDTLKPSETKRRRKMQRNTEDDRCKHSKSANRTHGTEEDSDLKNVKVMLKNFPKMPLKELARHEGYLVRRAEQIEKLRKKMDSRRENLMRQFKQNLSNEHNEDNEKRNVRRRETRERLWEHDFLRRLTDQGKLIGIVINDDATRENDESIRQIYEDLTEEDRSEYLPELELPIRTSKLTLGDIYRIFSKAEQAYGDRHKSESYENYHHPEYAKESPVNELHKWEESVALRVSDMHKLNNASNKARKFSTLLPNPGQPDLNQITKDKAREFNNNTANSTARVTESSMEITNRGDLATDYTRNDRDKREQSNVEVAADANDVKDITEPKGFSADEKYTVLNGARSKDAKLSIEPEDPDNKDGDVAYDEITTVTDKKLYGSSDDIAQTTNNADDATASTLGKVDTRARRNVERISPDRTDTKNEIKRGEYIYPKEGSIEEIFNERQIIPFVRLTKFPSNSAQSRTPKNNMVSSYKSSVIDQWNAEKYKSPRYTTLASTEVDDARSYETLKMKNPENSLEHFKISSWLDQSRRIADSMAQHLNDLSSDEYEDILNTINKSSENISDEEISFSSDRSNESVRKKQGIPKDHENRGFDHESRKQDERHGIKNKAFDMYSRIRDQMRVDERQVFMLLPWLNAKTTRQRRQIGNEIDKSRGYERIKVDNEEYEYSLNKNNGNKKEIERKTYPRIQNDNEVRDDLLKDFMKARKNDVSRKDEKNDENFKSNILEDIKFPQFTEETLENVIDSMEETQNLIEPAEQSVDYSVKKFSGNPAVDEDKMSKNRTSENNISAFHVAIKNIKKIFTFFSGLSRILSI